MDQELDISHYFSLENCHFSLLWKKKEAVFSPLLSLTEYFATRALGKIEVSLPPSVYLEDISLISIGKGTIVEPGAYIQGPCVIGEHCRIRSSAYLRDHVLIGDHCVIGHGTEVKQSILLSHVHAAHFSYIGNSILGHHVNLGAGVKCANFRLDGKEILISLKGKKIKSGTNKMGAIIGDGVQIGCNSVLSPATFVGKNSFCYPLLSLKGFIPPNSVVKKEESFQIIPKRETP